MSVNWKKVFEIFIFFT